MASTMTATASAATPPLVETDRGSSPDPDTDTSAHLSASIIAANEEAAQALDDSERAPSRTSSASQQLTKEKALGKLEELLSKATAYTTFLEGQIESVRGEKRARFSQPKSMTGGVMKDYQLDGLQWLIGLWDNGLNGALACFFCCCCRNHRHGVTGRLTRGAWQASLLMKWAWARRFKPLG